MDKMAYLQWANIFSWLASGGFWLASALIRLPDIPLTASMTVIPIAKALKRQSRFSQVAAGFATVAAFLQAFAAS